MEERMQAKIQLYENYEDIVAKASVNDAIYKRT